MIEKHRLDNGITVICDQEDFFKTFSLGFWVKAGSIYENSTNNGYTHLIEHMLFKGTQKRSYQDISNEIDAAGGQMNAFTERENTCFYVHLMSQHQQLGVDVLWDMISNSVMDADELEKEKMVIVEEIKMYDDTPEELVHDLFTAHLWKDHPLGYPILGPIENIENADRDKVISFFHQFYKPENIVVSISGNFDKKDLLSQIEKLPFHNIANGGSKSPENKELNTNYSSACTSKDLEQVHFIFGFPAFSRSNPDRYALFLLNNILGGGSSSRLFLEVREKLGLAYSIYSYHSLYQDGGILGISSSTSLENYKVVLETISLEIQKILNDGIHEAELSRAKEQLKGGVAFSRENLESRMNRNAKYELNYNRYISYEEIVNKIDSVSLGDINELFEKIFKPEVFAFYSLGPKDHSNIFSNKLFI